MSSSKLEARLKEIDALPYDEAWKAKQKELAIQNAETYDSITDGGRYKPKGLSDGEAYWPHQPINDLPSERIIWEDAKDPS